MYRTRAISRGLYIFTPFFTAVYIVEVIITDNLCTRQGNSSVFGPKIRGFKSRAGYNGACTVNELKINGIEAIVEFYLCSCGSILMI